MTASHTLSTSVTTGITLTASGADGSPFTITSTGAINDSSATEAYGALTGTVLATVTNAGHVASNNYGIYLRDGGLITNTGAVYGANVGVKGEHISTLVSLNPAKFVYNANTTTLVNSGSIGANGYAVNFFYGGAVANNGTITGGGSGTGVSIHTLAGTVINTGTIAAGVAVQLTNGGYASNASTGVLLTNGPTYGTGIELGSGNAIVVNAGHITAASEGIYDRSGGSVDIRNTGTIIGGLPANSYVYDAGIRIYGATGGVTITNSGLIESEQGAGSEAITITSAALDLIVSTSASFVGSITADASFTNNLELTSGASTGTISGIGTSFTGFASIAIENGATWDLSGNLAGLEAAKITGLTGSDLIDISNETIASDSFNSATGLLTLFNPGHVAIGTLDVSFATITAGETLGVQADGHGGTDLTNNAICYLRGTHILTAQGEKPVETIAIGELVMTRFSGLQPVRWIGRQSFARRFIENNPAKIPVHIRAHALGPNVPARSLFVSPGHSLLLGETLLLARQLVNGVTITQALGEAATIEYFQFELDQHDCLLAEGSWAESFADGPGLRAQFHNAAAYLAAHPAYNEPSQVSLCAPRPESGPVVEAALRPMLARATTTLRPGQLEGWTDMLTPTAITGWARDLAHPALPVELDLWSGATKLGTSLACMARDDLSGLGKGNCAFHFTPATALTPAQLAALRICRTADNAALPETANCRQSRVA